MSNDGFLLNATTISLAGAVSVSRSANQGITTIGTLVPGDTLSLGAGVVSCGTANTACLSNSGNTAIGGQLNVGSDICTQGALSSAAGILSVGNLTGVSSGGITIGAPASSSNSFLWHAGFSSNANHWDLVGGDLRVTRVHSGSRSVSYTLRVADDDAFEIHQSTSNLVGQSSHRRVARFGGVHGN